MLLQVRIGQRLAHPAQRAQADAHLQQHRDDQSGAQNDEGPDQRAVEVGGLVVDLRQIAGDREDVGAAVVGARGRGDGKFDAPRHCAQLLIFGTLRIAPGEAVAHAHNFQVDRLVE